MIQCRVSLFRLPVGLQPTDLFRGEGRDLFPRWAPAGACPWAGRRPDPWAGVTEFFFGGSIGPVWTNESSDWI
jgi:hypothetical protein